MPSAKSRARRVSSNARVSVQLRRLNSYLERTVLVRLDDPSGSYIMAEMEPSPFDYSRDVIIYPDLHKAYEPDARAKAILRGNQQKLKDLKASGGAFTLQEVQGLLGGISRQAVHKKVKEGYLLAVPGPSDSTVYPTAQFMTDGSLVPGLKAIQEALPSRNPWFVLNYLVQPEALLDGRPPLEHLKEGNIELVVQAAGRLGEMGS